MSQLPANKTPEIVDEWDLIFEQVKAESKKNAPACPIDPKERANCSWCEG